MYVVAYYIVFAMRNESTMVNSKKIKILYYCFHYNARPNYLSCGMSNVYQYSLTLNVYSQNGPIAQSVRALV